MESAAPYGITTRQYHRRLCDPKYNESERVMMRWWEEINATDNPPLSKILAKLNHESSTEPFLPLCGPYDHILAGKVAAVMQWTATDVGRNGYERLCRMDNPPSTVEAVLTWFDEHYPDYKHNVVHDCTERCFEWDYHLFLGWGRYCKPELQAEVAYDLLGETILWLLSVEGRIFYREYEARFAAQLATT